MQQDNRKAYLIQDREQDYYKVPANQYQAKYPPPSPQQQPPLLPYYQQQQNGRVQVSVANHQVRAPPGKLVQIIDYHSKEDSSQTFFLCKKSRVSILITCPYCQIQGNTRLKFEVGQGTQCCCILLCTFCCCLSLIPFCLDSYQDVHHMCSNCGQLLGKCPYKTCE